MNKIKIKKKKKKRPVPITQQSTGSGRVLAARFRLHQEATASLWGLVLNLPGLSLSVESPVSLWQLGGPPCC
jgi:hypothetical protein